MFCSMQMHSLIVSI